jgi:hypothetical protein
MKPGYIWRLTCSETQVGADVSRPRRECQRGGQPRPDSIAPIVAESRSTITLTKRIFQRCTAIRGAWCERECTRRGPRTLLHLASYFPELNLVRMLLRHGATSMQRTTGRTPLHRLFWEADDYSDEDFFGVAQLLMERGADVNARDKNYETPLHLACYAPDPKLVQMLLDCGANVNAEDNRGRTPLHRVFLEAKYYSDEEFFGVVHGYWWNEART